MGIRERERETGDCNIKIGAGEKKLTDVTTSMKK